METNSKEENKIKKSINQINNCIKGEELANLAYPAIIIIFFIFFNILYQTIDISKISIIGKVSSFVFLLLSITIIEIAYKKDNDKITLHGMEFLVLAIFMLLAEHISKTINIKIQTYTLVGSIIFAIYYILKTVIIYTIENRKKLESYSDIKEIVKEEPIKRTTTRKNKKNNEIKKDEEK